MAGLVNDGCRSPSRVPLKPAATAKPPALPKLVDRTEETLARTHKEVVRLASQYPERSLIRTVYLGDLTKVSPVLRNPLKVGIADPKVAYASVYWGNARYSKEERFRFFVTKGEKSVADYASLVSMDLAVLFSSSWLMSENDEVKKLGLEKEAYNVAQWEQFSKFAYENALNQGRIERIDPKVTDREIAWTLARSLIIENSLVRKLVDYSGYLPLLSGVRVLSEKDGQTAKELSYSNLLSIYQGAAKLGIKFDGVVFGSEEFYRLAYGTDSPWVKMIENSAIPGPVPVPSSR